MEKPALINIDYTYDFVAEDGKLTSGEPGQAIEGKIVALTKQFIEAGEYVVFAWFVANINFSVKKTILENSLSQNSKIKLKHAHSVIERLQLNL